MNVDLPAPLGPNSPVMPGGTDTVTSLRPMTWPYHFETCSAVTMAALISQPGGLRPASPPCTLAHGDPRAPRSARVAHSLSLVRKASCHDLHPADAALEDGDGQHDEADNHEQR